MSMSCLSFYAQLYSLILAYKAVNVYVSVHFIVVTWPRVICLKCPSPRVQPEDSRVPMLQLLSNTSVKANSLNANTSTTTGFFIYACRKGPIMVIQQVTL